MIETQALTKRYADQLTAVDDLNLNIEAGDVFGFIGPNGAGKTTTMKMLATLLKPTSGEAYIDGFSVTRNYHDVRRIIGYMPDFFGAYEDMKVKEYLEFFAAAYKIDNAQRGGVIADVLELTDLGHKQETLVQHLSRGMQQRLGLARVLVHDPKVLLLDEPASGLDPRARIEMRELLKELRNMGKTILISSHILHELGELCNKIGIIEQGKLLFAGSVQEVMQRLNKGRNVVVAVNEEHTRVIAFLQKLDPVADVTERGGKLWITLAETQQDISVIPKLLLKGGFSLTYFSEAAVNLEEIFMQLTQGIVS